MTTGETIDEHLGTLKGYPPLRRVVNCVLLGVNREFILDLTIEEKLISIIYTLGEPIVALRDYGTITHDDAPNRRRRVLRPRANVSGLVKEPFDPFGCDFARHEVTAAPTMPLILALSKDSNTFFIQVRTRPFRTKDAPELVNAV